jgi:murein DD-endopeptidase MepM/ murein hydrolase activator NlpD
MPSLRAILLLGCLLCALFPALSGQSQPGYAGRDRLEFLGSEPLMPEHPAVSCLSSVQADAIQMQLERQREYLRSAGLLPPALRTRTLGSVGLEWPVRSAAGSGYQDISALSALVDHNPSSGHQDYACGGRSFNAHSGTDIFPWPFPWMAMDSGYAEVVAAASGVILFKQDSLFDRSCEHNEQPWNAVYVQHVDGTTAWYGHLKAGSLTSKASGERVAAGEYLGRIGSSGNSTGPHLHFELRMPDGRVVDPFQGSCNAEEVESWWKEQPPYSWPGLSRIATHSTIPKLPNCGADGEEEPRLSNRFLAGDEVILGVYLRDPRFGQKLTIRLIQPDGRTLLQHVHSLSFTAIAGSAWFRFPTRNRGMAGSWTAEVDYEGGTYSHSFEVCQSEVLCSCPTPSALEQRASAPGSVSLGWTGDRSSEEYQVTLWLDGANSRTYYTGQEELLLAGLPSVQLSWRVRARCGYLSSHWSPVYSGASIQEIGTESAAPSPGSPLRMHTGWIWKGVREQEILLYDLSGALLDQRRGEDLPAPFGLLPGLYLLERREPGGGRHFARVSW